MAAGSDRPAVAWGAVRRATALLTVGLILAAASRSTAGLVDQQQVVTDPEAPTFRVGGPGRQELAQTITAGLDGRLTEIRVPVACPIGDLLLEIQGVSVSVPNGIVHAAETVPGELLPADPNGLLFRSVPLAAAPVFARGARYAVVLRANGTCEVAAGPVGDPYPGGDGLFRDRAVAAGDWVALGSRADLPFQAVVETSPSPGPREQDRRAFVRVNCFLHTLSR